MQAISDTLKTNIAKQERDIDQSVEIDWNLDGAYDSETHRVLGISVDRSVKEPLGGIHIAQADIRLDNNNNRYTPD